MRLALLTLIPAIIAAPAPAPAPALAQTPGPHAGHQTPANQSAADSHAGHQMPAASAQPAPDPHAGHNMTATTRQQAAPAGASPADPHAGHQTPVEPSAPDPHAGHSMPAASPPAADPHAGHAMPAAPDPHAGHTMPPSPSEHTSQVMTGADQPVGNAPPPPPPTDNAADRVFGVRPMSRARDILREEHGGARISKVMADILEYRSEPAGGGYAWDVEAWYGGDINRFVVKSEGEGGRREGAEAAEVQALYSRAVARYTDVQAGTRYDVEPEGRAYATLGVESLLPYWFEAEAAVFLSDRGDLLARVEGSYDFRLTQRLVLQPQAELEFAAQDIPETDTGSGLSGTELGLRLRYEIRREFAPYIGVTYERSFGRTADFARAAGADRESTSFVVGLRAWF